MSNSSHLRPAAGIIPVRERPGSPLEVFLVHRSVRGSFFPGYHAFPGGAQDQGDSDIPGLPATLACALRELFEETGMWPGAAPGSERRRALLDGGSFREILAEFPPRIDKIVSAGIRNTPAYSPIRFTAQFYLWDAAEAGPAEIWPPELESGAWWPLEKALAAWRSNEIALAAPTQSALLALAHGPTPEDAAAQLVLQDEETGDLIPAAPGWAYVALRTPTLPPAQHTLAYLIGEEDFVLIDPGSSEPEELSRLEGVLGERRPRAVIFTHHHSDHVGGRHWAAERGYPLWGHARTAELVPDVPWARFLEDGDKIALGNQQELTVLHTPGHAPGHIALWEEKRAILLAADLVSSVSTILVAPPEGDMAQYLAGLSRCRALKPRLLFPSHGGPFGPGSDLLGKTLEHRLAREKKIFESLQVAPQDLETLLATAYDDAAPATLPLARASLLAHLEKLRAEGRAVQTDSGWSHT